MLRASSRFLAAAATVTATSDFSQCHWLVRLSLPHVHYPIIFEPKEDCALHWNIFQASKPSGLPVCSHAFERKRE